MAFDFKKEYKELYLPKRTPELVSVPPMTFVLSLIHISEPTRPY